MPVRGLGWHWLWALGKLTTGTPKFRGSGFVGMHVKPITAQEKFNFPRANAILARAQALQPGSLLPALLEEGSGSTEPAGLRGWYCIRNLVYKLVRQR